MPHFSMQATPSGQGALAGTSQQAQFLLVFAGAIIFAQSLMPAISSAEADAAALCVDIVTAALAEATGVSAKDSAIKTAKIRCNGRSS